MVKKQTSASGADETSKTPAGRRRRGRSPETRQKLIEAARRVMSRDGVEGSSIPVIVEEAGVARGSFYNHFGSKEELARAVLHEQTITLREELYAVSRPAHDIPRAITYGTRRCLQMAGEDPVWGWFIIQVIPVLEDFSQVMQDLALFGLIRGKSLGSLRLRDLEAAMMLLSASVTALLHARLTEALDEARAFEAIEYILRLVGVDPDLAAEITAEPTELLREKLGLPAARVAKVA